MKLELAASLFLLLLTATVGRSGLILRPPVGEYLYAKVETEIEIECRYTGNGDGVFTWTGPALMSGGNRVETVLGQSPTGHPNSVLRIRDVCVSDAGTYHCRHSAVNDEELIRVNVTADPMIKSAPSSQEFVEGADALVMCVVDLGMPQGHILWYKDGRAVEYSDRIYINGQSGLQINSIEQEDEGEYTCVVERQGWGSEQEEITVTVTTPGCEAPNIATSMSAHLEVLYNESLDITCLLQPDSGSAEIWWTTPTGGIVRQPDLHVEPPCSPGGYICVANSLENCGSDSHAVAVSVLAPPSPPSRDEEIATSEGATVVLECSVDEMPIANPEPTYTWRYLSDGSSEFPARMVVTDKNDLKIIGVTAEDYTKYECIVENRIGRSVVVVQLTPPTPMPSPMPSPTPSPTPMPTPTPMTKASVTLFLEYQVPYEVSIDCHPVLIYPQLGQKIEEEMKTLCDCTEISLTPYPKCLSDNTKAIYTLTVEAVDAQELVDRFITNVDTGMWKPDIPGLTVTTCESEEVCTPPPNPQTGEDDAAVRNGLIGGILIVAIVCVASIVTGVIYCSYKSRKSRVATSTDPELANKNQETTTAPDPLQNQETTTAPDPLQDLQQNQELLQSYLVCTHPGIPHTVVNTDLHYPNPPQCLLHQGCVRMNVSHVHPPSQAPPFTSRSPPTRPPSSQRPTSLPLHHSTHQQSEH